MKTLRYSLGTLAGISLLGIFAWTMPDEGETDDRDSQQPQPVAATENGSGSGSSGSDCKPCLAHKSWFKEPTGLPNALKRMLRTAEDFPNANNCDFHQWAWKTFLVLMSPAHPNDPNGPRIFEGLADPDDLFRPDGPKQGYPGRPKGDGPDYFLNQAGPNDNVLVDQKKQLVYFSVFLNKTYWNFVVENKYYKLSKLESADNSDAEFPVGTLELKVSWRVVSEGPKVYIEDAEKSYYVIDAKVPNYAVRNNRVVATGGTRAVKLAMVGMHVAGVVKDNPEFIWATFEQLDNAPNFKAKAPFPASVSLPATTGPFGGKGPWSLYKVGTPSNETNIFDTSAPTAPANITRLDPWGGGPICNTTQIIALNKEVWAELPANRQLLKNYFEVGAIWTNGVLPLNDAGFPPVGPSGALIGSFNADNPQAGLANTTMETFTQIQNCFYCHNAGFHTVQVLQSDGTQKAQIVKAKPLNLSHFVVNYQAEQQLKNKKGGK